MASIINATTSTGLVSSADNSGSLQLATNNGTTAVTIDTSQNVGIGTTSPGYKLDVVVNSNSIQGQRIYNSSSGSGAYSILWFGNDISATQAGVFVNSNANTTYGGAGSLNLYQGGAYPIAFSTNNTERMRIFSTGQVAIGTNNFNTGFGGAFTVLASTSNGSMNGIQALTSTGSYALIVANTNGSGGNLVWWAYNGSNVGTVTTNGSSTSYNTTSDYRLKENVAPMTGALATVAQLKPVTYTWKSNGSDGQGFIAHELQAVVPDAVSGEKDAIETYKDEDGNEQTRIKPQGVDTSFLVATLTAAIQELKAELDATKAEVQALKGVA